MNSRPIAPPAYDSVVGSIARPPVQRVHTTEAARPLGQYSQAFKVNGTIFVAGQVATDNNGAFIKGTRADQAFQIFRNIDAILRAAGSGLDRVVKTTVYFRETPNPPDFNVIYNRMLPHQPPRTNVGVDWLPCKAAFQVEVIAVE